MKIIALFVTTTLAIVGCGGDTEGMGLAPAQPGPTPPAAQPASYADRALEGGWGLEINSACAAVMTFDNAKRAYSGQLICETTNGTFGSEMEIGDLAYPAAGQIRLTPQQASCASTDHSAETDSYKISGDNLTILSSSGAVIFKRIPSSSGGSSGIVIQFGCWDMGKFSAHPIQAVR